MKTICGIVIGLSFLLCFDQTLAEGNSSVFSEDGLDGIINATATQQTENGTGYYLMHRSEAPASENEIVDVYMETIGNPNAQFTSKRDGKVDEFFEAILYLDRMFTHDKIRLLTSTQVEIQKAKMEISRDRFQNTGTCSSDIEAVLLAAREHIQWAVES